MEVTYEKTKCQKTYIDYFHAFIRPRDFHQRDIQLCNLLRCDRFGSDSGGTSREKAFLPLFLLDGAFYGYWDSNQEVPALTGNPRCIGEREMYFL